MRVRLEVKRRMYYAMLESSYMAAFAPIHEMQVRVGNAVSPEGQMNETGVSSCELQMTAALGVKYRGRRFSSSLVKLWPKCMARAPV